MPARFSRFPTRFAAFGAFALVALAACYAVRPSRGGGQARPGERQYSAADIALPAGYRIELVASGLTYPSAAALDDTGGLYVVEGGYAYGDAYATPKLLKVMGRNLFYTVAAAPDSNGPWTGAIFVADEGGKGRGSFYVAEGGHRKGGRILRVGLDGGIEPLTEGLPSLGDHHTNGPALGPDGMLYFGQGTTTNSGVVGEDNASFGWLGKHPEVHDVPCQDVALAGRNFATRRDRRETVTGAFLPYGTPSSADQIVRGEIPCNGAILRLPRRGGKPELVAWGFRNPFALAFAPDGRFFVIDNGYDERGSRPVWGAGELLWEVRQGSWYGWPDYSGNKPLDRDEFAPPHGERPAKLLRRPPGPWLATQAAAGPTSPEAAPDLPPAPAAVLPVHASADGIDFSASEAFGHVGEAFVAEFGDMAPGAGKVLEPVGFKVVRVDPARGVAEDFAINRAGLGPASRLKSKGLERPVAVRFSPDGKSLYVVDFGVLAMDGETARPRPRTGAVWRIWKADGT